MSTHDQEPKEYSKEELQSMLDNVIDAAKQKVFSRLIREGQRIPESNQVDQNYCGLINAEVIALLSQEYKIPGMEFTLIVDRHQGVHFKYNPNWDFHSIGVFLIKGNPDDEDAAFAVIDASSKEDDKNYIRVGTLLHLSETLHEDFGGNWDLDFISKNPNFNISTKIKASQEFIQQNKQLDYDRDFSAPGTSDIRPLGISSQDIGQNDRAFRMKARNNPFFTHPHA